MKICFMCDLHLSYNKTTIQYDAFEWACNDLVKKKTDVVVFAGDFTAEGNVFAARRFLRRIEQLEIPAVILAGNSDYRTQKNIPYIQEAVSPLINNFSDIRILALNTAAGTLTEEEFTALEKADTHTYVVMHHPAKDLDRVTAKRFTEWREAHPEVYVFSAHLHQSAVNGRDVSLQALDPDKAIGESPCITYFDTETEEFRKAYYFCPLPDDFLRYIGISCYEPLEDLYYSAAHALKCVELRPNALQCDKKELAQHVRVWRKAGGTNLSMHAPEIGYTIDGMSGMEDWDVFTEYAAFLGADRITMHVPDITLDIARKNPAVMAEIVDFLIRRIALLPQKCKICVENMHMRPGEIDDGSRRFGYAPEECVEFMKILQERSTRDVYINLDIGHARNNAPYDHRFPLSTWYAELGRYIMGYHLHQVVKTPAGLKNHMPFDSPYGSLISLASFFRCWQNGQLAKAPIIFEIREKGSYASTVEMFEKLGERKVFDLHSHTLFSACGRDKPERLIETAIQNGITLLGITDHSYGIGERKALYLKKIREYAVRFSDRIKVLCGIEIPTLPELFDLQNPAEIAEYDYCLIEHITDDKSIVGGDLIDFCKRLGIRCGIAHTDLFAYCEKYGYQPKEYFMRLAEAGIFWEMNVCYDSIHFYREHSYVKEFMRDEGKQQTVKTSGLAVSIGSDSHRREDYDGYKLYEMYDFLKQKEIRTADQYFTIQ